MKEARASRGPLRAALSWLVVIAAAWLAVGSQPVALSCLLAAVGALYLLFPPAGLLPRAPLFLTSILILLALLAFLPAAWIEGSFHQPFVDRGFVLPATVSPQPWWTLEDLTLFAASLLWAWNCLESRFSAEQRQQLFSWYVFALAPVALSVLFSGTSLGQSLPAFWQQLGHFANRNQTGDLLLMGGIVSFGLGVGRLSQKNWQGLGWMVLTLLFFAAMILNGSRASVCLFALGLILHFFLTPRTRNRRFVTFAAFLAIGLLGALVFAGVGTDLGLRFRDLLIGRDGRLSIYRDTMVMILHSPWFGVGLGNFEGIYNTHRVYTAQLPFRSLHPESDWLWLAAELGIPGLIAGACLAGVILRTYLQKTPFPALTRTSFIIALLFLIHGLFDVGGHRLGAVWNCLYLVGLGSFCSVSPTDLRVPVLVWRSLGVGFLVIAALRIQSMNVHPWMPTQASEAAVEQALHRNPPLVLQKNLLDRSLGWAPLDWILHYQRGFVSLQSPEEARNAGTDFTQALYLEQNTPDLPLAIDEACRRSPLPEALTIRENLLGLIRVRDKALFTNLYDSALDKTGPTGLSTLAGGDPGLEANAVVHQDAPAFDTWRQNLLAANPDLTGVPPPLARALFDRWAAIGDGPELIRQWPLHPSWQSPGWRAYAKALAKAGRYGDALDTAYRFLPAPHLPKIDPLPSVDDAMSLYQANPQDPYAGITLYFVQNAAGAKQDGLVTLQQVAKLPQSPNYIAYLLAQNLHATNQDEAAWPVLAPLLDTP